VVGGAVATVICAVAVVQVASSTPPNQRFARALLEGLVVGVPLAVGLDATRNAHTRRFGLLLIAAGAAWSLTAFGESPDSLPYSLGRVSAWLIFPSTIYLMLAFPHGRLTAGDRRLFGGLTTLVAVAFIGSAFFVEAYPTDTPWASCDRSCPPNALLVLHAQPPVMDDVVRPVRETTAILLLLGVTQSLVRRWSSAPVLRRRTLAPVTAMSLVSVVSLIAYLFVRMLRPDAMAVDVLGFVWALSIPGLAAGFMIGLLRRRVEIGHALARLNLVLTRPEPAGQVHAMLAAALEETTIDLLLPDDLPGRWRDAGGRLVSRAALVADGHAVTVVDDGGDPVAALVRDSGATEDDELLQAVGAVVLATLRHERLNVRLAASLAALADSRKRIAAAADSERARIERDLHDGAQQRLIGLRIKLTLAEELTQADPAAGAEAVRRLGTDVERTLEELRSLAHGVYPSALSDRGLAAALRSALADSPVPVHLSIDGLTRLPQEIETAVYFACLEAVQNAVKHAGATRLWVVAHQDGALRFQVIDDGVGFTPPSGPGNGGLRNMRDRIEAVGGRLTLATAPGYGTRVRGTVPLPGPP
jgi:signal transduction histidine kinase